MWIWREKCRIPCQFFSKKAYRFHSKITFSFACSLLVDLIRKLRIKIYDPDPSLVSICSLPKQYSTSASLQCQVQYAVNSHNPGPFFWAFVHLWREKRKCGLWSRVLLGGIFGSMAQCRSTWMKTDPDAYCTCCTHPFLRWILLYLAGMIQPSQCCCPRF